MKLTYLLSLLAALTLLLGAVPTARTVEPLNRLNDAESAEQPPFSFFSDSSVPPTIQSSASDWHIKCVDCPKYITMTDRSLRLDGDGRPHIAYGSNHHHHLYYARHDGEEWHIETVDDTPGAGKYASLALDTSTGRPHISYCLYSNYTCDVLRYAWYDGMTWHIETVDTEGGWCPTLALDTAGHPHISYSNGYYLKHAWHDGTTWHIETVDTEGGSYNSLALDTQDNPHISYEANCVLRYARHDGVTWHIETVDTVGVWHTSLALDAADRPHIGYALGALGLRYAWHDGATWHVEEVRTGAWSVYDTSLALDELGRPHISYYDDYPNGEIKYAWHNGLDWQIETVAGGSNPSLALDEANRPHISYRDNGLKYAVGNPAPALLLDKQAIPNALYANDTLTYTLSFLSLGSNGRLWDPLPESVDYVSGSITSTLAPPAIYSPTARAILWQGTLSPVTLQTLRFQVTPNITDPETLPSPISITNTAWLTTTDNGAVFSTTATVNLMPPLLALDKQVMFTEQLRNNKTLTYTLTLTGAGLNVHFQDSLPDSVDYILGSITSTLTPPPVYSSTTRAVQWQGTLPTETHQALRFQVTLNADDLGTSSSPLLITNTAWLTNVASGRTISATASLNTIIPAAGWQIDTVDLYKEFCCMTDRSLRLDDEGHPHIAYGERHLYYAWYDGGEWHYETVDDAPDVGRYASLALDGLGNPHISYYDGANRDLKYAWRDGVIWHTETVDSQGWVGYHTSLSLDPGCYRPHCLSGGWPD